MKAFAPDPLPSTTPPIDPADAELRETFDVLRHLARNKSGPLTPEDLATHVLSVTVGADFPVRRAAMEALLRRVASAAEGEHRILERPDRRAVCGAYRIGRRDGRDQYVTLLTSLSPLAGSCDCRDFGRSALGLCKHLLVLAEVLQAKRAEAWQPSGPRLCWDPVRPLTGMGDWLERVTFHQAPTPGRSSKVLLAVRSCFDGRGALLLHHRDDPARRARLVELLLAFATSAPGGQRADPALLPLLVRERDRLAQALSSRWSDQELLARVRTLKQRPYPYQLEGVRRFLESGRLLLADDMGLGKTAQAIASCHVLFTAGRISRGLLLVPAALKSQWAREWSQFTDAPVCVVDGNPAERAAAYRACKKGFLIANYEQVLRDLPLMHRFMPDLVVLDEAQRIKNWAAKTSVYVKQLKPRWRLVLSGTPMENRLDELASLMDWVDDLALEPKWRLAPWHTTFADGSGEVTGARNLDTLRTRLSGRMVRRVRQEVLSQLPKRTDTQVPVPLTGDQQAAHDDLNQPIAALMNKGKTRPLTQPEFLKLMSLLNTQRVICNGLAQLHFEEHWPGLGAAPRPTEALLEGLRAPKLLELRELIANVAVTQGRKVVVFSQWRRMLKLAQWAVSDVLAEAGLRAAFFTGEEGQRRRTQNVVDFHDDPELRVLFASDAGGVGLNLQKAANCCINLELPWNPAVLEQRIGRVYRLGQSRPVDVYNLISAGGIESRIATLVGAKQALFKGLFDGGSDEVRFEQSGSFMDRIQKVVEKVELPELPDGDGELDSAVEPEPALPMAAEPPPTLRVEPRTAPPPQIPLAPEAVRSWFERIEVRPEPDGRISLTAPAEAAGTLAALFEGMAKLLASAPPPPR